MTTLALIFRLHVDIYTHDWAAECLLPQFRD